MRDSINFLLNGRPISTHRRPDMTVLEWLRGEALLRGTKEGCAEGDCGACSVLVRRANSKHSTDHLATNSCIMLLGQLDGCELVTVEGLAESSELGHIVQQKMAENGSSQCGFCTPGIVASLAGLLERNQSPDDDEIHDALAGNLCRCTGYRPIIEAAREAAKEHSAYLARPKLPKPALEMGTSDCVFFAPTSLKDLLSLKAKHRKAKLLAGGTDMSLPVAHAEERWSEIISTRNVKELQKITKSNRHLNFGGSVTWEQALPFIDRNWPSFAILVRRFGSTQIRSMGTIAGNLANASPIGDGAPALLALNASVVLTSTKGARELPLEKFFKGYRKSALKADEIISEIRVPLPKPSQEMRVYKISKRYDQDISTVCGAFSVTLKNGVVEDCKIAFGGMAATSQRCKAAEKILIGQSIDDDLISMAKSKIRSSFEPMDDMRGSAEYRSIVSANLLERFVQDVVGEDIGVMGL